jgi:hypothetical protein
MLTKWGNHLLAAAMARNAANDCFRFVIARGNSPELFDAVEHPLDAIAVLISRQSQAGGFFLVGRGGMTGACHEKEALGVSIRSLVGKQAARPVYGHCEKSWSGEIVGRFASRQD